MRNRIYAILGIILAWTIAVYWWFEPNPYNPPFPEEQTEEIIRWKQLQEKPKETVPETIRQETEWVYEDIPLDPDIQEYMHRMCVDMNISYAFALALMESESSFIEDAVGDGGESIGYMQINRCNWEWFLEERGLDVHEPADNVAAGLYMIKMLFEQNDDPYRVIICYKAGETKGDELYEQGIFKTKDYDCAAICQRAAQIEKDHEKEDWGENDWNRNDNVLVLCKRH